ncbi:B-cell receptor-associated protein 31 [Ischnura elegans]|uniref:B-cell receptor-associated protein 31 n=1 Tax=Ischnura elegans TaxID=197161 RepID=UPI001ED8753B|nr:B-cell receptor-associated protein 31 [Ischnura elegans]
MSIQWTIACGILVVEVVIVSALLCPLIPPSRWQKIMRSRFVESFKNKAYVLFGVMFITLLIFFCDSIREMRKYSGKIAGEGEHFHVADETHASLRLFRAQRNFYISGFALFFMWVIKRLLSVISAQATIMAESVAILRQAESASSQARTLLNLQSGSSPSGEAHQNVTNEAHDLELKEFKKKVDSLEQDLMRERKEKSLLRSKVEHINAEYDKLVEEHGKLQGKRDESERKHD